MLRSVSTESSTPVLFTTKAMRGVVSGEDGFVAVPRQFQSRALLRQLPHLEQSKAVNLIM